MPALETACDLLCHRHPGRCLADETVVGPVLCARCTGMYLGALVGLCLHGAWQPRRWWWPLAIILVVATPIQVMGESIGWWTGGLLLRYGLAVGCGAALVSLLARLAQIRHRPHLLWRCLTAWWVLVAAVVPLMGTTNIWWTGVTWLSLSGVAVLAVAATLTPLLAWRKPQ